MPSGVGTAASCRRVNFAVDAMSVASLIRYFLHSGIFGFVLRKRLLMVVQLFGAPCQIMMGAVISKHTQER